MVYVYSIPLIQYPRFSLVSSANTHHFTKSFGNSIGWRAALATAAHPPCRNCISTLYIYIHTHSEGEAHQCVIRRWVDHLQDSIIIFHSVSLLVKIYCHLKKYIVYRIYAMIFNEQLWGFIDECQYSKVVHGHSIFFYFCINHIHNAKINFT